MADTEIRVGTRLTTIEQIKALPVGAEIGLHANQHSDAIIDRYVKQADGRWLPDGIGHDYLSDHHFTLNGLNEITSLPEPGESDDQARRIEELEQALREARHDRDRAQQLVVAWEQWLEQVENHLHSEADRRGLCSAADDAFNTAPPTPSGRDMHGRATNWAVSFTVTLATYDNIVVEATTAEEAEQLAREELGMRDDTRHTIGGRVFVVDGDPEAEVEEA